MRASRAYWETSGRQMGDKRENHAARALRASRAYWETERQMGNKWKTSIKSCGQSTESIAYWETSGRQLGDKYKIMRPAHSEHPELTGRQALRASRAYWETSGTVSYTHLTLPTKLEV